MNKEQQIKERNRMRLALRRQSHRLQRALDEAAKSITNFTNEINKLDAQPGTVAKESNDSEA